MKYTTTEKVEHLVNSAIEAIRAQEKNGRAPILMVFSDPNVPGELHAIAATGLDAKELIEDLATSPFGRFH